MSGGITVQRVNSWFIQSKDVLTKYVITEMFEEFGGEIDTSCYGLRMQPLRKCEYGRVGVLGYENDLIDFFGVWNILKQVCWGVEFFYTSSQ